MSSWTRVQVNSAYDNTNDTSWSVSLTGVTAGNLILLFIRWSGGATTTVSVSDGTSSLDIGTQQAFEGGNSVALFAWLLAANSGNRTYTITLGAARIHKCALIAEFSHAATAVQDGEATGTGTSTTPNSGEISTTGTDEIAFGYYADTTGQVPTASSETINNATRDDFFDQPGQPNFNERVWHKAFDSTWGPEDAACAIATSGEWACGLVAFKVAGVGITPAIGALALAGLLAFTAFLEQEGFRWRADDGSESGASWLAGQDVSITRGKTTNTRLRAVVDTRGDSPSTAHKLQYRKQGDPEWRDV